MKYIEQTKITISAMKGPVIKKKGNKYNENFMYFNKSKFKLILNI